MSLVEPRMPRRCLTALLLSLIASLLVAATPAVAQAGGALVSYAAGWSLVSGPPGSDLSTAFGALYTIQPGDQTYEQVAPGQGTKTGYGYWANLATSTRMRLAAGSPAPYSVAAPAGQWIMIGNPSGSEVAGVTGADTVYTYDPTSGYQRTTILAPGRGAFAIANADGTITVTPATPGSFYTIATPRGTQFRVPSEWLQRPVPAEFPGPQTVDALVETPDGGTSAIASVRIDSTATIPVADRDNLPDFITYLLSNDAQRRGVAGSFRIATAPESLDVTGAEAAALGSATYTDTAGVGQAEIILVAVRGSTLYRFELETTVAYLADHQQLLAEIAASFQILPPPS